MPPQTIYPNSVDFQIKYNDPSALGEGRCPIHSFIVSIKYSAWHIVDA